VVTEDLLRPAKRNSARLSEEGSSAWKPSSDKRGQVECVLISFVANGLQRIGISRRYQRRWNWEKNGK
jgi:hypothetical protein